MPARAIETEYEIKRSRFLTRVDHASTAEDAHSVIAETRRSHPDANHVCWAFVAGVPGNTTSLGCSDDGEPAGTAGKPMLNVLLHGDIGFVVAATVRYFGGVKLGTGGLVRAYTQGLVTALESLETTAWTERTTLLTSMPYAFESTARRLAETHGAALVSVEYADTVHMTFEVDLHHGDDLTGALIDLSAGQVEILRP